MGAVFGWAAILAVIWGGVEAYQRWPWQAAAVTVALVAAAVAWWRRAGRRIDRDTRDWNASLGLAVLAHLHSPAGPGPVPSLVAEADRLIGDHPKGREVADLIRQRGAAEDARWRARQAREAGR